MRFTRLVLAALVATVPVACSFLLDFDKLQAESGSDASLGGSAGSDGSAGSSGTGGSAGAAGAAGTAGAAGAAGADAGPPSVALDDMPKALGDAVCANIEVCLGPGKEFLLGQEDCNTYFENVLRDGPIAALKTSLSAGVTYDPVKGAQCVKALETLTTAGTCAELDKFFEDCKAAFVGLGKENDPCKHGFACGEGLYCPITNCAAEKCTKYKTQGAACTTTDECASGLTCFIKEAVDGGSAGNGTCQPYVPIGSQCDQAGVGQTPDCVIGGFCIGPNSNKKCQKITDLFTSKLGCYDNSTFCEAGKSCELSGGIPFLWSGQCVNEVAGGGACQLSFPDMCAAGKYCPAPWYNSSSNCLDLPLEDQPCAATFQQSLGFAPACAPGLVCVASVCKPRRKLGEPCEVSEQCYSASCAPADGGAKICVPAVCP